MSAERDAPTPASRQKMKISHLAMVLGALCCLGARPVPEKIESLEHLQKASADAQVAVVDFTVPAQKTAAERALSRRYFNQPLEERFSGVTTSAWEKKWDLMAAVLIDKAKQQKLDATSLAACLKALNRGHTEETMLRFVDDSVLVPSSEKPTESAAREGEEQPQYESTEAAIPVGAFLAKHAGGCCWIIVCNWEDPGPDMTLGHVRVWALDTVTHESVAYVTCD